MRPDLVRLPVGIFAAGQTDAPRHGWIGGSRHVIVHVQRPDIAIGGAPRPQAQVARSSAEKRA
jgi:hypothetical protein